MPFEVRRRVVVVRSVLQTGGRIDRHPATFEDEPADVVVPLEIGPVVGVLVAQDDGVDVAEPDVTLQVGERSRAGVDPNGRVVVAHEVPAARPARARVGARAPEGGDSQDHAHASTQPSSGPSSCPPNSLNQPTSPEEMKWWRPVFIA